MNSGRGQRITQRWFFSMDPRSRLLGFIALLGTLVLGPLPTWTQLAAFAALFAMIGFLAGSPLRGFLPKLLLLSPLFLALLVSNLFWNGNTLFFDTGALTAGKLLVLLQGETGKIICRIALALLLAHILATSLKLDAFSRALSGLRVPQSTVTSTMLTLRYFGILRDEAASIRMAMRARGFRPRWAGQVKMLGSVISALFFRSLARGERIHHAMLARGYGERETGVVVPVGRAPRELLFPLLLPLGGLLILMVFP